MPRPEISSGSIPLTSTTPFRKAKINQQGVKNKNFFFVGGSIISERGGGWGGGGVVSEVCRVRLKSETPPRLISRTISGVLTTSVTTY